MTEWWKRRKSLLLFCVSKNAICIKMPFFSSHIYSFFSTHIIDCRSLCTNKRSVSPNVTPLQKTKVSILEYVYIHLGDVYVYMETFFVIHSQPTCSLVALTKKKIRKKKKEKWTLKWLVGNSWVDWHMLMKYSQFIWRHKKGSVLSIFCWYEKSESEISKWITWGKGWIF